MRLSFCPKSSSKKTQPYAFLALYVRADFCSCIIPYFFFCGIGSSNWSMASKGLSSFPLLHSWQSG